MRCRARAGSPAVAGARVFVNASRHEDWGLAQMEALSAGTPLVTVPSAGANVALPLAAELAPELVAPDRTPQALARALRAGLALDERGAGALRGGRGSGCWSRIARGCSEAGG